MKKESNIFLKLKKKMGDLALKKLMGELIQLSG